MAWLSHIGLLPASPHIGCLLSSTSLGSHSCGHTFQGQDELLAVLEGSRTMFSQSGTEGAWSRHPLPQTRAGQARGSPGHLVSLRGQAKAKVRLGRGPAGGPSLVACAPHTLRGSFGSYVVNLSLPLHRTHVSWQQSSPGKSGAQC